MSSSFLITGSLLDVDVDWLMLAQLERGIKTIRQERCAFSITEDHLSQRGVGFDHDAGTIVPCSVRVNPHNSQEGEKRQVTHCQADCWVWWRLRPTWLLWPTVHETPTVVTQAQGVLPEGKPALHAQDHTVLPSCLTRVDETLALKVPWLLALGSYASLTGWGAVMSERLSACGLWSGHHLMWHINCLEMLAVFLALNTFSQY